MRSSEMCCYTNEIILGTGEEGGFGASENNILKYSTSRVIHEIYILFNLR